MAQPSYLTLREVQGVQDMGDAPPPWIDRRMAMAALRAGRAA